MNFGKIVKAHFLLVLKHSYIKGESLINRGKININLVSLDKNLQEVFPN